MEHTYEEVNILVEEELSEEEIQIETEDNEDTDIIIEEEYSVLNMDYKYAMNKPSINEVILVGNRQLEDLFIFDLTNTELEEIIDFDSY